MERQEFTAQVDAIGRGMDSTVRIVFADGESHLTFTKTIKEDVGEYVYYQDVHCAFDSGPIKVPYGYIARVEIYDWRKMSS